MLVRVPETEVDAEAHREVGVGAGAGAGAEVVAIDFRETSPAGSEKEMYGANKAGRYAAQVGGLAIGVPGELRGLEAGEQANMFQDSNRADARSQRTSCMEDSRGRTSSCP
jgi:gamma-glutamyltranspeptidase/glutathione hydrolase/leukotriene-C4 hydrolase